MVDQDKIILMSKIAVYEKRFIRKDQRITDYFIEDYIYINNFIIRVGISLITILFIAIGGFQIIYNDIIFPYSIEQFVEVYIGPYIGPWISAMLVYTFISSLVYRAKYKQASKRMDTYKKLLEELKEYEG